MSGVIHDEPGKAKSSVSFNSAATRVLVSGLKVAERHSIILGEAMLENDSNDERLWAHRVMNHVTFQWQSHTNGRIEACEALVCQKNTKSRIIPRSSIALCLLVQGSEAVLAVHFLTPQCPEISSSRM
jgi:hypothetical protein